MGLCMALSMNSVEFLGDFGATPDFLENLGFGVVSDDLGGSKGFCANPEIFQTNTRQSMDV